MLCSLCNHDPCTAIVFGQILEGELSVINDSLDVSKKWNHLYHTFVAAEHRILRYRVCIHILKCVVAFICSLIPSPDNHYTGHHDIDVEGNKTNRNNESFEEATPDSNIHGSIDCTSGGKVELTILFDNDEFDITHICKFVSKSPMHGWNITFLGNEYTEANLLCNSE